MQLCCHGCNGVRTAAYVECQHHQIGNIPMVALDGCFSCFPAQRSSRYGCDGKQFCKKSFGHAHHGDSQRPSLCCVAMDHTHALTNKPKKFEEKEWEHGPDVVNFARYVRKDLCLMKIDDFDAFPLAPDERSCQNHCWDNAFCYIYVYLSEKVQVPTHHRRLIMGLSGLTSMAPTGVMTPAALPTEKDIVLPGDRLSQKRQAAYVLIIGGGVTSHWCSLWMFESGQVYSMELTAINEVTGYRWLQSRYKMRRLHSRAQLKDGVRARPFFPAAPCQSRHSESEGCETCVKDLALYGYCEALCSCLAMAILSPRGTAAVPSTFPEVVELVWPIVQDFVHASGGRNYVMSGMICIDGTSPHDLRKSAGMVPLNTSFYDLFFHNCQLFILQLLCGQYGVEFAQLPFAVGSVIAGPTLLVLEVTFVALFHHLQHQQPCMAMLVGIAWVATEIYLTWRYVYSYRLKPTSGTVVGSVSTLLVWIVICATGASDSAFAGSIPVLSLVWDMCMVAEALTVNMVFRNTALTVVNLMLIAVAIVIVAYLQWIDGWPVQDLLVPMCGVPIAIGNITLAASLYSRVPKVPAAPFYDDDETSSEREQRLALQGQFNKFILFAAALLLASFILPVVALVMTLEFLSQLQIGMVKL
ncbi:unnamed protein product [Symbiodinium sp. CCMP2592]|nr:unnamed protein product [Symbiodinium sp. CCMP2592]